jgi:hypothetical protein
MKKKVNDYAKGMFTIVGTGIGVGVAGVVASELGAEELGVGLGKAAGTLTPIAAGLYTLKFANDMLSSKDLNLGYRVATRGIDKARKKKKGKYYGL